MPYPDLGTMYQNGMGATASLLGGQMASTAQAQDAEKLREMQMKNQQDAIMNPLNAQFRQGQIAQQGAELPGIQGTSASLVAKGSEEMQTLSAKVAAKLSSLSTQIGADGMARQGQDGEKLAHLAKIVANYPPAMQKEVFAKGFAAYGGDVNSPIVRSILQVDPEHFQKAAETMGNGMALAGQKYQQESAIAKSGQDSHERIGAANNRTSIEVAKINAASREAAAKARAGMMKHMNSDQQLTALTAVPVDERTPDEQARILELSNQRIAEKTAPANAVAATVMNQDTPQQTGQKTAANIHGAPKAAAGDFTSAAKAQWPDYNPSLYDYRMGPDGVVQRKKK